MSSTPPITDGSQTRLADTLCARLCHDLSGPLGTLIGALELAMEDPAAREEALPLASEAATVMGHRLRLLRAAWAGDCGALSPSQLGMLAAGLPPRVTARLDHLQGTEYPGPLARVLVNLLLLGADALPQGGWIALEGSPDSDIVMTVEGPHAAWPAGLAGTLTGAVSSDLDDPRAIQAPLAGMLARAAGLRLQVLMSPGLAATGAPPLLLAPI